MRIQTTTTTETHQALGYLSIPVYLAISPFKVKEVVLVFSLVPLLLHRFSIRAIVGLKTHIIYHVLLMACLSSANHMLKVAVWGI